MIGEVKIIAFDKQIRGFLDCDGRAVYISDYPGLFDLLGHRFGDTAPDKMFYLPNLPVVWDGLKAVIQAEGDAPKIVKGLKK